MSEHVAAAAAAHGYTADQLDWVTPEGIDVKPVYIAADRDAVVEAGYPLDSFPGAPPFVRGPYPTMYVNQPWTIRQYAGLLDRRRVQRVLPPQSGRRPEGSVGGLRPRDPPRLRLRPPACAG